MSRLIRRPALSMEMGQARSLVALKHPKKGPIVERSLRSSYNGSFLFRKTSPLIDIYIMLSFADSYSFLVIYR